MLALLLIAIVVVFLLALVENASSSQPRLRNQAHDQIYDPAVRLRIGSGPRVSPEKRLRESREYWVSPGETRVVASATLPSGMLYIGKQMHSADGSPDEPGHIDPSLPVSTGHQTVLDSSLGYWPLYGQADPTDRRSYLNWLAGGRRDPAAGITYVFLFYYGIERRLLFDSMHLSRVVAPEVPALVAELEKLFAVYGENRSFSHYCGSLLAWVKTQWDLWGAPHDIKAPDLGVRRYPTDADRVALARFCSGGVPLPADWALAWLFMHPQVKLRTPARRCPSEFQELFRLCYADRYGDGIEIRPLKKRIRLDYHPASSGLTHHQFRRETDLPDVALAKAPINKIIKVAEEVQGQLDAFSRWVGKHGDSSSAAAIARLPLTLAATRQSAEGDRIRDWAETCLQNGDVAVVATDELLALWPGTSNSKVTIGEARVLADFLDRRFIGIEPDPRYGGRNPSALDSVAIFRRKPGDGQPGDMVKAAGLLLQLGVAVAVADGTVDEAEERHLTASLEDALALPAADRRRLQAHTARLLADPPGVSGVKSQAQELSIETRRAAARFLIGVAAADGRVTADEITLLRRIYRALDLDPDSVYGEVHALAAGLPDVGPVPVISPSGRSGGHAIPKRVPGPTEVVTLDLERVEHIRRETHAAAALLADIFGDGQSPDEQDPDAIGDEHAEEELEEAYVAGLDSAHSDALIILSGRESWSRSELTDLAEEHGLMAGGMIETINEVAFTMVGEPLLEGHDPVELNAYALEAMLA